MIEIKIITDDAKKGKEKVVYEVNAINTSGAELVSTLGMLELAKSKILAIALAEQKSKETKR